jgi:hypothetical protein
MYTINKGLDDQPGKVTLFDDIQPSVVLLKKNIMMEAFHVIKFPEMNWMMMTHAWMIKNW